MLNFAHTSSIKPRILSQKDFMRRNSQCVMELDLGRAFFFAFIESKEFFSASWKEEERNQYSNFLGGKVFSLCVIPLRYKKSLKVMDEPSV